MRIPIGRWQAPVYSPLTWRAFGEVLREHLVRSSAGTDARQRLARALGAEFGGRNVILCGSGTDALTRAIHLGAASRAEGSADGSARRGAVALPAYTCFDVATAAVGARMPIMLYDVDPHTLGPDLDSLRRVLEEGARVVVVASLYGMPVDWGEVEALASAAGAVVVEDAAQGQGAAWRGRPLGSLGEIGVLSFGRGKGWTGGGGGALLYGAGKLWEDVDLAAPGGLALGPSSSASILVRAALQWGLSRPYAYGIPASIPWIGLGETRYRDPVPARELSPVSALLLEATWHEARKAAETRRRVALELLERLGEGGRVKTIRPVEGATPGYLRLPLRGPGGGSGLSRSRMARRLGIAPGYPSTLGALAPVRARLVGEVREWPGAESLVADLLTLPTHQLLSPGDLARLVRYLSRSSVVSPGNSVAAMHQSAGARPA